MTIIRSSESHAPVRRLAVSVLMLWLAGLVAPGSANAADAAAGKALALQWCSSCHLVAENQPSASSTSLPSFYDISKDDGWTEDKLAVFLADPHPLMPNMSLTNREIADLARYIDTLSD